MVAAAVTVGELLAADLGLEATVCLLYTPRCV